MVDVQPSKVKLLVAVCVLLAGCAPRVSLGDDLAKPPPAPLPLFDGSDTRTHQPPSGELVRPVVPDHRKLYSMVLSCWPADSWFRGELYAEARMSTRTDSGSSSTYDATTGTVTTQRGDKYIALVARIPIASAIELDKERSREAERRGKVAEAVGDLVSAFSERVINARQLLLTRALEKRSQERVRVGVAETNEQVRYLEQVALLESKVEMLQAAEIKARLHIVGMCDARKMGLIDDYLGNFKGAH